MICHFSLFELCFLFSCRRACLPACLRPLLACLLCHNRLDSRLQVAPEPPLPTYPPPSSHLSHPTQQGPAAERPQSTLPLSAHHWTGSMRGLHRADVLGDRGSVAGTSCSTLTPSEHMDMRRLLRTRAQQRHIRLSALNCFRNNNTSGS